MPHVSKNPLQKSIEEEIDRRILSLLVDANFRTRRQVFDEVITRTERVMIAKRLTLLLLLSKGIPVYEISRFLKVSSSTIYRFEEAMREGKYAKTIEWIVPKGVGGKILSILSELADITFSAKHKSVLEVLRDREGVRPKKRR